MEFIKVKIIMVNKIIKNKLMKKQNRLYKNKRKLVQLKYN